MSTKKQLPQPEPTPEPVEDTVDDFIQSTLATWNPDAIPAPAGDAVAPTELYDYVPTAEDMSMPRIKLAQFLTPEVVNGAARAGEWIVPGEEPQREVAILITGMRLTRELRDAERQVACSSPNGQVGVGTPGGECAACPFMQWGQDANGKGVPPACTAQYRYLAMTQAGAYFELIFQKTQTAAARTLNPYMAVRKPNQALAVKLGSELKRDNMKSWYVPVIKGVQLVSR